MDKQPVESDVAILSSYEVELKGARRRAMMIHMTASVFKSLGENLMYSSGYKHMRDNPEDTAV